MSAGIPLTDDDPLAVVAGHRPRYPGHQDTGGVVSVRAQTPVPGGAAPRRGRSCPAPAWATGRRRRVCSSGLATSCRCPCWTPSSPISNPWQPTSAACWESDGRDERVHDDREHPAGDGPPGGGGRAALDATLGPTTPHGSRTRRWRSSLRLAREAAYISTSMVPSHRSSRRPGSCRTSRRFNNRTRFTEGTRGCAPWCNG